MKKKGMVVDRSSGKSRRARLGGWVLTQFQAALALLGVAVCLVLFFGLGFLFGVWYQANEKIRPTDNAIALAEEQLQREPTPAAAEKEITFYSTLTKQDGETTVSDNSEVKVPSEVMTASPPAVALTDTETPSPKVESQVGVRDSDAVTSAALPQAEASQAGTSTVAAVPQDAAVTQVAPEPQKAEPSVTVPSGSDSVPVSAPKPVKTAALAPSVPVAPPPSGTGFTVQVGSFRKAEDADRLQQRLSQKGYAARVRRISLPGKGLWHRVRVGSFGDRSEANQLAQRLRSQEKMTVLVTKTSN